MSNDNKPPLLDPAQIQQAKDGLTVIIHRDGALRRQVMGLATTGGGSIYGIGGVARRVQDYYSQSRPTNAQEFDKRLAGLGLLEIYLVGEASMYAENETNAADWLRDLSQSLQEEKGNIEVGILLLIGRAQTDAISEQGFRTAVDSIKQAGLWPWPL